MMGGGGGLVSRATNGYLHSMSLLGTYVILKCGWI